MEKLERLISGDQNSLLIKLRMNDIFDEDIYKQIKNELLSLLVKFESENVIPKYLLPLLIDTFLSLSSQAEISKHAEKISMPIDELSAIVRNKLTKE